MPILNFNVDRSVRLVLDRGKRWFSRPSNPDTGVGLSGLPAVGAPGLLGPADPLTQSRSGPAAPPPGGSGLPSALFAAPDPPGLRPRQPGQPHDARDVRDLGFSIDDTDLRRNLRSIESHLFDDHYVKFFKPGDFVLQVIINGPTHVLIPAATPRWPAITFPKNGVANTLAAVDFRKGSEWRQGRFTFRYWYTSPVASTANFLIQLSLDAAKTGEVLPATNLYSANTAVPGPAVINTIMRSPSLPSTILTSTGSMGPDDELFSLRVTRMSTNASDTNANDFNFLGIEVVHVSTVAEG